MVGFEPRAVASFALVARCSNFSARSQSQIYAGLFEGLLPAEFQEKLVYPDKPPILQVRMNLDITVFTQIHTESE